MTENFLNYNAQTKKIDVIKKDEKKKNFNNIVTLLKEGLIFYYQKKLENKIIKTPNSLNDNIFKEMKILVLNIKKYFKEENPNLGYICYDDNIRSILILEYSTLLTITDILVNIIEKIKNIQELENFSIKQYDLNFKIKDYFAKDIIDNFSEIKTIKIRLNCKNEDKMNLDVIILFSHFFKILFPACINLDFDYNIIPINIEFQKKNIYKINENNIISFCQKYEKVFISNLILAKSSYSNLDINSLSIKIYDSYQIESHYILSKILSNYEDNNKSKLINSNMRTMASSNEIQNCYSLPINNPFSSADDKKIFYHNDFNNKLMKFELFINNFIKNYFELIFEINSFDPLLFNYCNQSLVKDENLCKLKLILFPSEKISFRKILLNSEKYDTYSKTKFNFDNKSINDSQSKINKTEDTLNDTLKNENKDINIYENNKMLYYDYLSEKKTINQDSLIITNETILNELFINFNKNLFDLSTILDHKMGDFIQLSINLSYNSFNLNNNIENFDNYNSSISCFIINLFTSIQNLAFKLNYLEIIFDDDNQSKNILIELIKKQKYYYYKGGFKFNKLKISELYFDFRNVSSLLQFENFPSELSNLQLKKLSSNDFILFLKNYKSEKNVFKKLETLYISFDYDFNFKIELFEEFILAFNNQLKTVVIEVPINLNFDMLIRLIETNKKNNVNTLLKLKIFLKEFSSKNSEPAIKNTDCKIFENQLINKNIVKKISYCNFNDLIINILYYKKEDKKKLLPIIYCFEKIRIDKKHDIKKIFQNIFYKITNLSEKKMEIEIL